jgi:hypothetical protein
MVLPVPDVLIVHPISQMLADQANLDDLTARFMTDNIQVIRKQLLIKALNMHLYKTSQRLSCANTTASDLRHDLELSQL